MTDRIGTRWTSKRRGIKEEATGDIRANREPRIKLLMNLLRPRSYNHSSFTTSRLPCTKIHALPPLLSYWFWIIFSIKLPLTIHWKVEGEISLSLSLFPDGKRSLLILKNISVQLLSLAFQLVLRREKFETLNRIMKSSKGIYYFRGRVSNGSQHRGNFPLGKNVDGHSPSLGALHADTRTILYFSRPCVWNRYFPLRTGRRIKKSLRKRDI